MESAIFGQALREYFRPKRFLPWVFLGVPVHGHGLHLAKNSTRNQGTGELRECFLDLRVSHSRVGVCHIHHCDHKPGNRTEDDRLFVDAPSTEVEAAGFSISGFGHRRFCCRRCISVRCWLRWEHFAA